MKNQATNQTKFHAVAKPLALTMLFSAMFALSACSNDEAPQSTAETEKPAAQNAMDVKQPEPKPAPQPTLQQQTEDTAAKAAETISTAKEEVKQEVEKQVAEAAPAGATVYATCVGCHGAKGEGGMGPNLSSQTPADIVAKLKKYKAGEQMGPMTGVMAPMAAGLSEEDMQAVAEYVVTLK